MRCFEHIENESVAICSGCNKGICQQCFVVVENKLCCRSDTCKKNIEIVNKIIGRNEETISVTNNIIKRTGLLYTIIGLIFLITGLYTSYIYKSFDEISIFFSILGVVFLGYGVFSYGKKRLYRQ